MKSVIKSIIKIFFLKQIYFKSQEVGRNIIESNEIVHTITSSISFRLKNLINLDISKIPYFIAKKIDHNSIVIDCGANVGVIIKPLLNYKGIFYCFEPNPIAFAQLQENLGEDENIVLMNKAVGTESKFARLFKHISSGDDELMYSVSSSLLADKPNVDNNDYYDVEVVDFIDFLKSIEKNIYILKVDIEGLEIDLVNAILDHGLYNKIKYLFIETHENTIPDLKLSTDSLKTRTESLGIKNIYYNWT